MISEARSYSWVTQLLSLILGCLFSELSHHAARRRLQPQGEDMESSSRQQLQLKDQPTASMEHRQGVSQSAFRWLLYQPPSTAIAGEGK